MSSTVDEYYNKIQVESERMMEVLRRHEALYNRIVQIVHECGRPNALDGTYVDMGFMDGQVSGIIVQVHLQKHESFRVVAPLIEQMLTTGIAQRSQQDDADWGYREIIFAKDSPMWHKGMPQHTKYILVTMRIWPPSDSEVCERVECGTKLVYKLECMGDI